MQCSIVEVHFEGIEAGRTVRKIGGEASERPLPLSISARQPMERAARSLRLKYPRSDSLFRMYNCRVP
jgi:hypothetical protein